MAEKSNVEILKEELFLQQKNGRLIADDLVLSDAEQYAAG